MVQANNQQQKRPGCPDRASDFCVGRVGGGKKSEATDFRIPDVISTSAVATYAISLTHDLDAKVRKVREFIDDGSKVKLTVRFRGREAAHQQLGLSVLRRVADELKDEVRLERPPAMEGRSLSMVLIPSLQKAEERATQRVPSNRNQANKSENNTPGDNQPEQVEELADAKT